MPIRIPLSTELTEIQSAFTDVELALAEIRTLRSELAAIKGSSPTQSEIANTPSYVTQPDTVVEGNLRVTGGINVAGSVSMPSALGGVVKVTPASLGYVPPRVEVHGSLSVLGALMADRVTARENFIRVPYCRAARVAAQSIAYSTWTAVSLDNEYYDSHGFFTPTSKVMTIPSGMGGIYLARGSAFFPAGTGGIRGVGISINNSADTGTGLADENVYAFTALNVIYEITVLIPLVDGDTVTLKVIQSRDDTASMDVTSISLNRYLGTTLDIVRLGGL